MKKALIASTALVLIAGAAAADVTISGYGRTGVIYYEDAQQTGLDAFGEEGSDTQVISRLRMNIDAATSTDQGVDFGARFRIQWDQNSDNAGELNAGKLYITSSGLTVEVGNTETALDSAGLLYATELGSYDRSVAATPWVPSSPTKAKPMPMRTAWASSRRMPSTTSKFARRTSIRIRPALSKTRTCSATSKKNTASRWTTPGTSVWNCRAASL